MHILICTFILSSVLATPTIIKTSRPDNINLALNKKINSFPRSINNHYGVNNISTECYSSFYLNDIPLSSIQQIHFYTVDLGIEYNIGYIYVEMGLKLIEWENKLGELNIQLSNTPQSVKSLNSSSPNSSIWVHSFPYQKPFQHIFITTYSPLRTPSRYFCIWCRHIHWFSLCLLQVFENTEQTPRGPLTTSQSPEVIDTKLEVLRWLMLVVPLSTLACFIIISICLCIRYKCQTHNENKKAEVQNKEVKRKVNEVMQRARRQAKNKYKMKKTPIENNIAKLSFDKEMETNLKTFGVKSNITKTKSNIIKTKINQKTKTPPTSSSLHSNVAHIKKSNVPQSNVPKSNVPKKAKPSLATSKDKNTAKKRT